MEGTSCKLEKFAGAKREKNCLLRLALSICFYCFFVCLLIVCEESFLFFGVCCVQSCLFIFFCLAFVF